MSQTWLRLGFAVALAALGACANDKREAWSIESRLMFPVDVDAFVQFVLADKQLLSDPRNNPELDDLQKGYVASIEGADSTKYVLASFPIKNEASHAYTAIFQDCKGSLGEYRMISVGVTGLNTAEWHFREFSSSHGKHLNFPDACAPCEE